MPARTGLRSRRRWLVGLVALATAAGVGTTVLATRPSAALQTPTASAAPSVAPAPPPVTPVVQLSGASSAGTLSWRGPLAVRATDGVLTEVTGTGPRGVVPGSLQADGTWAVAGRLVPSSTYRLSATVRDSAGTLHSLPLTARTRAPDRVLTAMLSPGDDRVVGVGQPVAVTLDHPVRTAAARAAVVRRLRVTTSPAVPGAWRWMNDLEVHYRAAALWWAGTTIRVAVDLDRLELPDERWGSGRVTSSFRVGDAGTSVVDTRRHTMTVSRNGRVLRVMKASMGKPEFATRNGVFLVLEKFEDRIMDSATVDLPPGTPAYRTAVKHAVRITNSGTFTHGAPWSLRSQGVANVSHGCINLSPTDAQWYYQQAKRGDVVQVIGSTRGPDPYDPGSRDWNMSFARWSAT